MQLADDDMRSRVIASGLLRFWYHLYLLDSSRISKYLKVFPCCRSTEQRSTQS